MHSFILLLTELDCFNLYGCDSSHLCCERKALLLFISSVTTVEQLKKHKRKQAEERLKIGAAYENQDLIFAAEIGTPLLWRNLTRRHLKPLWKLAELPESIRLYDLRHTCATLLLSAGENPKIVSERLGHASIILTLRHLLARLTDDAASSN